MKNKILKSLGIIALIFTILITSVNASINSKTLTAKTPTVIKSYEDIMKELDLYDVYGDDYLKYLENNERLVEIALKAEALIKNNDSKTTKTYPSYYGGIYLSKDSLSLIVQIVEKNIPKKGTGEYDAYNKIINMDSAIKIQNVKYSLNELIEVNDAIYNYFFTPGKEVDYFLSANGVDTMNNTVVVSFKENTNKQQENFSKNVLNVVDSELITFRKATVSTTASELKPGGWVAVDPGYKCTMGPRIRYGNQIGYLTAGHCFHKSKVGLTTTTGTLKYKQFANNQNYDYAFVATNSSWTPTNKLSYGTTGITKLWVPNACPTLVAGMAVAKSGDATHYTPGIINSPMYWSSEDDDTGYTTHRMVWASIPVEKGDSGGPVFKPTTDANGGAKDIGIVSAKVAAAEGGGSMFTYIYDLPVAFQNRY